MKIVLKLSLATSLLLGAAFVFGPAAHAQSAAEINVRMSQMEDQMRHLMGQVEELSFQVRQLQNQLGKAQQTGSAEPEMAPQKPAKKQKIAAAGASEPGVERIDGGEPQAGGIETIITDEDGERVVIQKAREPGILGTLPGTDDVGGTGDFQGQVLVPPASTETSTSSQVETVALAPATGDSAETLYERSYESLLRRRFGEAENGFRSFLGQHRDHGLAGNAQYWLGETYYVQQDYKSAAQAFLTGVQEFPKSRKAADSLLKLGLSLKRLGQKQQACAAYAAVGDKFPKAVEAKKRADAESKRAGC